MYIFQEVHDHIQAERSNIEACQEIASLAQLWQRKQTVQYSTQKNVLQESTMKRYCLNLNFNDHNIDIT